MSLSSHHEPKSPAPRRCPRCGASDEHATDCMLDGKRRVFVDADGRNRTTIEFEYALSGPLKHHLLPWVSILAQRRKQAA